MIGHLIKKISPSVKFPNNECIPAELQSSIPALDTLSIKAKQATVLFHLKSVSLISLGQLYDD